MLNRAARDERARDVLVETCRRDPLFWMNAFCWVYEPRPIVVNGRRLPHQIPFIAWDHQVPAVHSIKEKLGVEDIGVEKSRGEGMSWLAILLGLHEWLYEPYSAIGLVSRNELAVDSPDDPDSLMWKIDWELTKMPRWMPGVKENEFDRNLSRHTLKNLLNGSTISGYAATGDVASGGRKKWFLMDELAKFPPGKDREAMASTQYVTNSRLVVSTPKGNEGAYYDLMHEPSSMLKVVLDWKQNPTRNRGLYRFEGVKPIAVDPVNNPLPPHYDPPTLETLSMFNRLRRKGFKLEGKLRSPWYDHECDRPGATPQNIAQELDRDYGGSMYRVFSEEFFTAGEKGVRPPNVRGNLDYDQESLEPIFGTTGDGPCMLWTELDHHGKPPVRMYAAGADICAGLGGSYSSNSVIQVIDLLSMEQVFEYAVNTIPPHEFADVCVAVCKFFHGAYLAWESNGSAGGAFTKRMKENKYPNVYYRTSLTRKGRKRGKELGWTTTENTKGMMFGDLMRAVRGSELTVHSELLLKECGQYVYINGLIKHILAQNTDDESSKGASHGDRAIALAVALQAAKDRPAASPQAQQEHIAQLSQYSMAWRLRQYEIEDAEKKKPSGWDRRNVWGMAHGDGYHAG